MYHSVPLLDRASLPLSLKMLNISNLKYFQISSLPAPASLRLQPGAPLCLSAGGRVVDVVDVVFDVVVVALLLPHDGVQQQGAAAAGQAWHEGPAVICTAH